MSCRGLEWEWNVRRRMAICLGYGPLYLEDQMMRPMILLAAILVLGCSGSDDTSDETGDTGSDFVCTEESDDECIQQACQACVDACDNDCSVEDLYPPQYSCPGLGYYLVEDFCPDWSAE